MKTVTCPWGRDRISLLYPYFQRGVFLKVKLGSSIRQVLCEQLGLSPDFVQKRIQTAFLDGKPVDDFETAKVAGGSILALSGALPGLAGATLRKGGFFSPLRASLSHRNDPEGENDEEGYITIRVFNILLPEIAPVLLGRGIYLPKEDFAALLADRTAEMREEAKKGGGTGSEGRERELVAGEAWTRADWVELRTRP